LILAAENGLAARLLSGCFFVRAAVRGRCILPPYLLLLQAPLQTEAPMSFKPILKFGENRWENHNLTFASYDEAAKMGTDLAMRWTYRARAALVNNFAARRAVLSAVDFEVDVSDLPVNYRITEADVLERVSPHGYRKNPQRGWLSRLGRR
jgi:hypothetical protein